MNPTDVPVPRRRADGTIWAKPGAERGSTVAARGSRKRFIDLSHPVEHGMITYPGMPGPTISDYRSREDSRGLYADGVEFHIGRIEMVANTGTYIDSPFHRYSGGRDLSQLALESIADVPGICITGVDRAVDVQAFEGRELGGKAVLINTGWSQYWRTGKYAEDPPFLTRRAADFLVSARAALVGIDSMNIDDIHDKSRPVHSILLKEDIQVVEHLTNLGELANGAFRFFAIPAPVKSFGSFPVRAFAIRD
jgi:arylformamidase